MRRAWAVGPVVMVTLVVGCTGEGPSEDVVTEVPSTATPASTPSTGPTDAPTVAASPSAPPAIDAEPFLVTTIAAGDQHACALDASGSAWCWGYGRAGQLGDGTREDARTPVAVAGGRTFAALAAGRYFTCGVDDAGAVACWGDNSRGQIGDGTTGAGGPDEDRDVPVTVDTSATLSGLVAGQLHVCGLDTERSAWCWGAYPSGQLAGDDRADRVRPGPSATGLRFASLGPSQGAHTCGIDAEGTAWCWGRANSGQLGDGQPSNAAQPEPRAVPAEVPFTAIATGDAHTCALDDGGSAWCWGGNRAGQIGDGTTEDRSTPVAVDTQVRFRSLSLGKEHTCAIAVDGSAWCWGDGSDGRLGTGERDVQASTPVEVAGDHRWEGLAAGEEFTCGWTTDGRAWCWGSNRTGWLGIDAEDRDGRPEPTPVAAP